MTSPLPQSRQIFLTPPNDLAQGEMLGFTARTVIVSNPTTAWWTLPDQQETIAPGTYRATIPMGSQRACIQFAAPAGIPNPTTSFDGQASFTFTEEAFPPHPGVSAYSLMPPGSNGLTFIIPSGTGKTVQLTGPTDHPVLIYGTNGLLVNVSGQMRVDIDVNTFSPDFPGNIAISNGIDSIHQYFVFDGFREWPRGRIPLGESLPARASLFLFQNCGQPLLGQILY